MLMEHRVLKLGSGCDLCRGSLQCRQAERSATPSCRAPETRMHILCHFCSVPMPLASPYGIPGGRMSVRIVDRRSATCAANSRLVRAQRARSCADSRAYTCRWTSAGSRLQSHEPE